MATTENQKKKVNQIILGLQSKEDKQILKSLKEVGKHGTSELIEHILLLLTKNSSQKIEQKILEILSSLKDEDAQQAVLNQLSSDLVAEKRAKLIATIWNAGYDASSHLKELVHIAINGNIKECLECITVIEESEPNFEPEELDDVIFDIQDYLSENDTDKTVLLETLLSYLESVKMF